MKNTMAKTLSPDKIRRFVKKYFAEHHQEALSFHTYSRAKSVVKAAEEIAVHYELSKEDHFALLAAAWFQSTGYLVSKDDPQKAGANLAEKFFVAKKIDPLQIERIAGIIMAPLQTDNTDDTEDILVRILLDALFDYLGSKSFLKQIELERREQQWLYGININKTDWLSSSYEWLADYKFHTVCALEKSKPGIDKNLKKLRDEFAERLIIDEDRSVLAEKSEDQKKSPIRPKRE